MFHEFKEYQPPLVRIEPGAEFQDKGKTYQLQQKLGEGGWGSVYQALDKQTGMTRAIKFMSLGMRAYKGMEERFEREVTVPGQFSSPFILNSIDRIEIDTPDGKRIGFVTEFLKGKNLRTELDVHRVGDVLGILEPELACEYIAEVALALAEMSEKGFAHRDLKPDNISFRRNV